MPDREPNLNEGKAWSEMDLFDLRNSLALGRSVAYIADFLCRGEEEVREKIAELGVVADRTQGLITQPREATAATHWKTHSWWVGAEAMRMYPTCNNPFLGKRHAFN
jgi:hypothetical protein